MNAKKELESLINDLGQDKYEFLNAVERTIERHLSDRSAKECLTFVERNNYGSIVRTWRPDASVDYIKCLTNFCSGSHFRGNELDSYLTDDIVSLVTTEFERFYENHSDKIAPALADALIKDEIFLSSLTDQLIEHTNSEIPAILKSKVAGVLLHKLNDVFNANISHSAAHAINVATTKAVATAVSLPIAHHTALIILRYLSLHLKAVLAKVLASTAIKSMIAAAVKKLVAAALITAIVKIVGAKLSLSAGAAFAFVLIPAVLAFIAYEAVNLPKNLGRKVSEKVRLELSGSFERINRDILEEAVTQILKAGAGALAFDIAQEPEIRDALNDLVDRFQKE